MKKITIFFKNKEHWERHRKQGYKLGLNMWFKSHWSTQMRVDYSSDLLTVLPKICFCLSWVQDSHLSRAVAECSSDMRSIREKRAELASVFRMNNESKLYMNIQEFHLQNSRWRNQNLKLPNALKNSTLRHFRFSGPKRETLGCFKL